MLVIYHSRGSLPARQAAALHLGLLPPAPPRTLAGLEEVYNFMGGAVLLSAEGLWPLGEDRWGRRVFAFGRASRPDVVYRAFHGLADIFQVEKRSFLLQNVGPGVAWPDLKVRALIAIGLHVPARRAHLTALRSGWADAGRAVELALERLAIFEREQA